MIKAVVIDDEAVAANVLQLMIERHVPYITDLRVANTITEGRALIQSFKPDLVFLDIVMPENNGFEFLSSIGNIDFEVIFTTAYDEYAIRAFRFSAFDYLLKPINAKELQTAVNRLYEKKTKLIQSKQQLDNLINNLRSNNQDDFKLAVPSVSGTLFFCVNDIIRLEGEGNYTRFYMNTGQNFISSKTLKEYAGMLESHNFLRIHKSHLVNKKYISAYQNEGLITLNNDTVLPVSRLRKQEVKSRLGN